MTASRQPVIAANWKLYKTLPEARQFLADFPQALATLSPDHALQNVTILICPTAVVLGALQEEMLQAASPQFELGAQNLAAQVEGAYTGEISAKMLAAQNIRWVIIGHSERRQYFGETDASVNQKVKLALNEGLTPIICVGETLAEREACQTDAIVRRQVKASLESLSAEILGTLVFAYEPVWAIGTGKTCDAAEANRVCALIRTVIQEVSPEAAQAVRIQYGGSVKPDNALELLGQSDIDGALVGGASLEAVAFASIVNAAMTALKPQEAVACSLS